MEYKQLRLNKTKKLTLKIDKFARDNKDQRAMLIDGLKHSI